jgi:hypothetical protein
VCWYECVTGTRHILILGLVAVTAMSIGACGGDDDADTRASEGSGEAAAPPPSASFNGLSAALEAQGLVVAALPKESLDGAEAGVKITGDKAGSARSFAAKTKASDYAGEVAKSGQKTTIVGAVVFQADTKKDADFFANAYEG